MSENSFKISDQALWGTLAARKPFSRIPINFTFAAAHGEKVRRGQAVGWASYERTMMEEWHLWLQLGYLWPMCIWLISLATRNGKFGCQDMNLNCSREYYIHTWIPDTHTTKSRTISMMDELPGMHMHIATPKEQWRTLYNFKFVDKTRGNATRSELVTRSLLSWS